MTVPHPSFLGRVDERAVSLIRAECEGPVGDMLLGRPGALARLHERVLVRWSVDAVSNPGVPEGLDMAAALIVSQVRGAGKSGRAYAS